MTGPRRSRSPNRRTSVRTRPGTSGRDHGGVIAWRGGFSSIYLVRSRGEGPSPFRPTGPLIPGDTMFRRKRSNSDAAAASSLSSPGLSAPGPDMHAMQDIYARVLQSFMVESTPGPAGPPPGAASPVSPPAASSSAPGDGAATGRCARSHLRRGREHFQPCIDGRLESEGQHTRCGLRQF